MTPEAASVSLAVPTAARWRARGSQAARVGLGYLLLTLILGLLTLPFSIRWFDVQDTVHAVRRPPSLRPVGPPTAYMEALEDVSSSRWLLRAGGWMYAALSWCGHDALGRSLLYRCLLGLLISLLIGLGAAAVSLTIGVFWGATAGLAGGTLDLLMMRVVDVLYGLPYVLMVILLRVALQRPLADLFGDRVQLANLVLLVAAIGGVSWLTMARVIRGQVLSLREQPFVEAARAMGAGSFHVLRWHLLPNLVGPISVYATLVVPQAVLQESFLSFLGLGIQQPLPSLGRLAADGVYAINSFVSFWWLIVFPCGLLFLTLLALHLVGDSLRAAWDPKTRT